MITVQILVRNNEKTIEKTLDSIQNAGASVIIGDLGCSDNTLKICKSRGAEIVKPRWNRDYSLVRNELSKEGMNFYLHPWEYIASGSELLSSCVGDSNVYVIQNGIVSKEIRIWDKKSKFTNPVYEAIENENAICLSDLIIVSEGAPDLRKEKSSICKDWISEKPTNSNPYYYMAISCLAERNYEEFYIYAKQYLDIDKNARASAIMLRYYMAHIEMHKGNLKSAFENLSTCLCYLPQFAEFWCLMGDIFYKSTDYKKAKCMYQNAITIGKRRGSGDSYPIEIEKYQQYPKKMINNIDVILKSSKIVKSVE